jgi:hypothetical protein
VNTEQNVGPADERTAQFVGRVHRIQTGSQE